MRRKQAKVNNFSPCIPYIEKSYCPVWLPLSLFFLRSVSNCVICDKSLPFFMTLLHMLKDIQSLYSESSIAVWLLTYTSPLILPKLQPCRWAEAANLPLNFLTTVLTVSKRACPGIWMREYKHKNKHLPSKCTNLATLIFFLSFCSG